MDVQGLDLSMLQRLQETIRQSWGFDALRPLQQAAMEAVLSRRDSLLVLPTGGGKSLCYQAPAVFSGETTVVISPLISLMKDQVDALLANGIAAVQFNSTIPPDERRRNAQDLLNGKVRLVFASPERMAMPAFRGLLMEAGVRTFAIDEAHCISHWGHDFRPEYRQLREIKDLFPDASVHAFTATATQQVRDDIIAQLGLRDPAVLIGNFDRPNLTYRVSNRGDLLPQVLEVLERHKGEAGIIYCIRRKDVDELTAALQHAGYHALPYHAGLSAEQRHQTQDAFSEEQCDLVVATVAFGMGIDRSNIRFVLHTGMPKSIEHYQQETGRAGRDGLEAECVLLYSPSDPMLWKNILDKSIQESEVPVDPEFIRSTRRHIADMEAYCRPVTCRHRALVAYFGQDYPQDNCQACDLCLGDVEAVPDSQIVAQKILSCVARVKENFGVNHVIGVLRGEKTAAIRDRHHDQLSTYGLLRECSKPQLRDWIQQLIGQGVLLQVGDEYPILKLNDGSWDVMKNRREIRLLQAPGGEKAERKSAKRSRADTASWEGVDRDLFDALRALRRDIAQTRGVAPYVVFSDATLRELARVRPSSLEQMRRIYGIGEQKLQNFGEQFLAVIDDHCRDRQLTRDNATLAPVSAPQPRQRTNLTFEVCCDLFRDGTSIDAVMTHSGRARSTVVGYLADYIAAERPESITPWIDPATYQTIATAARRVGTQRLKPIFIELGERYSYDQIRLVVAHLGQQDGTIV